MSDKTFTETSTVQQPIIDLLVAGGWTHIPGKVLPRTLESVIVESSVRAALIRLNPLITAKPDRADEVIAKLRTVILGVHNDGLVRTNEELLSWIRGNETHQFADHTTHEPIRLIDFDEAANNELVVSDEVAYGAAGNSARFDIVLWVNGLPLVVGETKSAVRDGPTWLGAAIEIHDVYEVKRPQFFVPNVLSFATDGKELRYGAVRQGIHLWEQWGSTATDANLSGWPRVKLSVELLLSPRTLLDIIRDFVLFERAIRDGVPIITKIVPRYPQHEAVLAIHGRALETGKRRGLLFHTQGSGKTLAMAYAAAKLVKESKLKNPTVIIVADRIQLVAQAYSQFKTAGMPSIHEATSAHDLRKVLSKDQRGVIFTLIHKFNGAGHLNDRDNIIVLIDEAHRTTEGSLGAQMIAALPNAAFFAFTGTPIADADRNTFTLFGDPRDPGHTLSTYDSDRSIADGVTVPIHVTPRPVRFNIDKEALDKEFEVMVEAEDLDDAEKELISARSGRLATFVANPERIRTVCEDIVNHFYGTVAPLGMKAQVVVYDRAMCVAYEREITRLLFERAEVGITPDEAAVVMTVSGKSDDEWAEYSLSDLQEEALLARFLSSSDRLRFLIVTAKLGTGFNAPIEGVMYLDKPLKMHTLFQTITRTNRTWKNPDTGQEKKYGLIVDYFGLGDGFVRAMAPADPTSKQREVDVDGLLDLFEEELEQALERFVGIDRTLADFASLEAARGRLPDGREKRRFAVRYDIVAGIWETLYPDVRLETHKADYRWLSRVYESVQPPGGLADLLWHRLGAKTTELIHRNLIGIGVEDSGFTAVIADEDTLKRLREAMPPSDVTDTGGDAITTVEEIVDSIAERIKKRLRTGNTTFTALSERLERLREAQLNRSTDSVEFLKKLLDLARDVRSAENDEAPGEETAPPLVLDPRVGALTQIFEEFKPVDVPLIIGDIVRDIDRIVKEVSYKDWSKTKAGDGLVRVEIRKVLKQYGLPLAGDLFDRAYEYIASNY